MEKITFEHGIKFKRADNKDEYVLRFKMPQIKISPDPTGDRLKQSESKVLFSIRSVIDKAMEGEI